MTTSALSVANDVMSAVLQLTLFLKLDDKLHRQLSCDIMPSDSSRDLVNELIHHSFISEEDGDKIVTFLEDALNRHRGSTSAITTI